MVFRFVVFIFQVVFLVLDTYFTTLNPIRIVNTFLYVAEYIDRNVQLISKNSISTILIDAKVSRFIDIHIHFSLFNSIVFL